MGRVIVNAQFLGGPTTAATGISASGTAHRMDKIQMPLRPALKSSYPADGFVKR